MVNRRGFLAGAASSLGNVNWQSKSVLALIAPPPMLTVSAWADKYAHLSPETCSSPGKFKSFAYQRGIMDAVSDPGVTQITVMKSARIGYTKCLDNIIGYFIHQDPSPILIVQPRVEDAEDYSRTEIEPMLRDTPVLAAIAGSLGAKDSSQRIVKRTFSNGASVSFVGANSPGGLRRITARTVCFDEVDGFPVKGAGNEGDQIALGIKRTETFWNSRTILGSTPTIKGISRIETAWGESDQRRYHVPCPHCGSMQTLKWANMRWDKDAEGKHLPETAHFVCEASGCIIEERYKPAMLDGGAWVAAKPFNGHAGFHIWSAYSLFPKARWPNLVAEFLRCRRDPTLLRTFVNLVLGETWEDETERLEGSSLLRRAENYGTENIPQRVLAITAGVDIQGDRLEVQVIGWGEREECWVIDYDIFYGDPAQQSVWVELDKFLLTKYHTDAGREIRIKAACIDTGGHHANSLIQFCKSRRSRNIYPVKGFAGPRPIWPKRSSKTKTSLMILKRFMAMNILTSPRCGSSPLTFNYTNF
jgi:phage terminase large subunit GpA-like protein